LVNRDKEILRLKSKVEREGVEPTFLVNEYEIKKQKDDVSRFEAQNELLNRQNLELKDTVEAMNAENRTKVVLRQEIDNLKRDKTLLEDKCESYGNLLAEATEKFEKLKRMRADDLRKLDDYESRKESEISDLKKEISELQAQLDTMKNEKISMMEENEKAKRTISAYHSDKRNFATALEKADTHKKDLETHIERHEIAIDKIKQDLVNKTEDYNRLENKFNELRKEKAHREDTIHHLHSEIDQLRAEVNKEKRSKAEVELNLTKAQGQAEEERARASRLDSRRIHLEDQLKSLTENVSYLKDQSEGKDVQHQRLDNAVTSMKKEIEFVKRDNRVLQDSLDDHKKKLEMEQIEKSKIVNELRRAEEKINILRREVETGAEIIRKRDDELLGIQREKGKLIGDVSNMAAKEEALGVAKKQIDHLNEKLIASDKIILSLKTEIEVLKVQVEGLQDTNKQYLEEKNRGEYMRRELEADLDQAKENTFNANLQIKQLEERLKVADRFKGDYSQSSTKVYALEGELRKVCDEKRERDEEIVFLKKVVGEKERSLASLSQELGRLQESVQSEKESSKKSMTLAAGLNEQIKKMELVIEELKSKLKHQQEFISAYEREIDEEKQTKRSTDLKLSEAAQRINQLQQMVQTLENSKEELMAKLKSEFSRGLDGESSFQRVAEDLRNCKQQLTQMNAELSNAKESLVLISQERDDMQFMLDEKTEQLELLKKNYKEVSEQLSEIKGKAIEKQGQSQQYVYRIEKRKIVSNFS